MEPTMIFFILAVFFVVFIGVILMVGSPFGGQNQQVRSNIRSMVSAQRADNSSVQHVEKKSNEPLVINEEEVAFPKVADGRLTFRKKLKFAQWQHVPPYVFSVGQIVISLAAFLFIRQFFGFGLQFYAITTGPMVMNFILMRRVNQRFKKFDSDYPQFLLSLVGLIKTGMNPIQALEAVANGLEVGSVVRMEVELMLERLRLGVPEERSVGSFGEDVNHPEIELFVQALILSRRLGGNLSDTLDRLAKQVRKRQYFRESANAAVGLQRGSIWAIIAILVGMEVFLFISWSQILKDMWNSSFGRTVIESSLCAILFGLWWVKQVTKIRT